MIPLPLYAKIKDRYCIGYFGQTTETLLDLKKARPFIEKELPGIKVYICCNDEKASVLDGEDCIILRSELETRLKEVAYFRELIEETVIDLLEESKIPYDAQSFSRLTA